MVDLIPIAEARADGERAAIRVTGLIFNIMRYCVHDGPGIRTTVFLKGCPLRCGWCHNPEGQQPERELFFYPGRCLGCGECARVCPSGAISQAEGRFAPIRDQCQRCGRCVEACYAEAREWSGKEMTAEQVMGEILRDLAFYQQSGGGVTISGGEPLLQPDFLEALLESCRARGVHTAVETTGFSSWEVLERIAARTDLFLYDVKLMDDQSHRRFTGVSNVRILENLSRLSLAGHAVVARMPILPGVNDGSENLQATAEFLRARTKVRQIHLLPFHRIGGDKAVRLGRKEGILDLPLPDGGHLPRIAAFFEHQGLTVKVGG